MQDYRWEKTKKLIETLGEIEVLRKVYAAIPGMPKIQERLLRHSLLKSAVFSARIEGIPATVQLPRVEAQNILAAYTKIFGEDKKADLSVEMIKRLHGQAMRNLSAVAGEWRNEPWAIFNQAGVAVHIAPPHFKLDELMQEYVAHINGLFDSSFAKPSLATDGLRFATHPVVVSAISQFVFEKIHPFADGNGRVGRLVSAYMLEKGGYGFKGLLMLEEFIEKNKEEYYAALEPSHEMTGFVEMFAEGVKIQAEAALERISREPEEAPAMLPRREEMLAIIKDHPRCSFDFIARRFAQVNPKTLHYDIGWLVKNGFVKKLGVSRGVVYEGK